MLLDLEFESLVFESGNLRPDLDDSEAEEHSRIPSLDHDFELDLSTEFDRELTDDCCGESYIEFKDGESHGRWLLDFEVSYSLSEPSVDM